MLDRLSSPSQEWHSSIQFSYWLQYHLHKQLSAASRYAAERHVALKGDLPIGVVGGCGRGRAGRGGEMGMGRLRWGVGEGGAEWRCCVAASHQSKAE